MSPDAPLPLSRGAELLLAALVEVAEEPKAPKPKRRRVRLGAYKPDREKWGVDAIVGWNLPHHGDKLPTCGTYFHMAHERDAEVHAKRFQHDCKRRECPECRILLDDAGKFTQVRGWVHDQALAATERLDGWKKVREDAGDKRPMIHITCSPPQEWAMDQMVAAPLFLKMRQHAYRVARSRGFHGGWCVFHPYRVPSKRWNKRLKCADGPHFHMVGYGNHYGRLPRAQVVEGFTRDGWVVKNLRARQSIYATCAYVLSHAGFPTLAKVSPYPASEEPTRRIMAATWFGEAGYNKLRVAPVPNEGIECGICDAPVGSRLWQRVLFVGLGPPPELDTLCRAGEWVGPFFVEDRIAAGEAIITIKPARPSWVDQYETRHRAKPPRIEGPAVREPYAIDGVPIWKMRADDPEAQALLESVRRGERLIAKGRSAVEMAAISVNREMWEAARAADERKKEYMRRVLGWDV